MQKILGYLRKAVQKYNMIENGDKIAVGVSGGKDSLILLEGLVRLRGFIGTDYEITALSVDAMFGGTAADFSEITKYCEKLGVHHQIIPTHIGEIVFDIRKEKSPCSLCARMRRGALNNAAAELGCNKLALGHNSDDAAETFIMNLFTEGRIGCFSPVTVLEDKNLTIIRPLILAPEKDIRRAARRSALPVLESSCPADGHTNRQKAKLLLSDLERENHGVKSRIIGAIQRDIWN
ncbi:MAG: tRNA 2-thiocytidine biosynthesis protein TtcA [Ruminococcus sp.]|nr:tRNA 2-thiocytidine biosynthesis protein TtcA [Ruminococcus sp.]